MLFQAVIVQTCLDQNFTQKGKDLLHVRAMAQLHVRAMAQLHVRAMAQLHVREMAQSSRSDTTSAFVGEMRKISRENELGACTVKISYRLREREKSFHQ
jgi:hypothetical protein